MVCQRANDGKYGPVRVLYYPGCPAKGCPDVLTSGVAGTTTVICGVEETPTEDFRYAKTESYLCNGKVKTNVSPTLSLLKPDGQPSSKSCSGTNQPLFFNAASEEPATREEVEKALNVLPAGARKNSAVAMGVVPLVAAVIVNSIMGWFR